MTEIRDVATEVLGFARKAPGLEADAIVRRTLRNLHVDQRTLAEMARRWLVELVAETRRADVRRVEKASFVVTEADRRAAQKAEDEEAFFGWYLHPESAPTFATSTKVRQRFRSWMRREGHNLDSWTERGHELVAERDGDKEAGWWLSDWNPSEYEYRISERRSKALQNIITEIREETRLTVTEELMAAQFALGDGHSVTWGDATVEQHKQRIEMLTRYAAGTLETAARHEQAVALIEESGVSCLRELAKDSPAVIRHSVLGGRDLLDVA